MDIKDAETKLDDADNFLTKLEKLLKKHWLILLLMLVAYFIYWALTSDFEEQQTRTNSTEELYIVDKYYDYEENGDSILIEVWNDGVETIAK